MKLFVTNSQNQTIYLNFSASSRDELMQKIGSPYFYLQGENYHVNNVKATKDSNNTGAGALIGGLIGLLEGPLGVLIGGAIGGLIGNSSDEEETRKVNAFNSSHVRE